jgi:hypothetical protein
MMPGYKTYIIAGLMFAYQMLGYLLYGQPVNLQAVLEAAGLATLRAGIAKP